MVVSAGAAHSGSTIAGGSGRYSMGGGANSTGGGTYSIVWCGASSCAGYGSSGMLSARVSAMNSSVMKDDGSICDAGAFSASVGRGAASQSAARRGSGVDGGADV